MFFVGSEQEGLRVGVKEAQGFARVHEIQAEGGAVDAPASDFHLSQFAFDEAVGHEGFGQVIVFGVENVVFLNA